ncbi:MAG: 50S ribosomal protein L28 [Candidatus Ancillula trichonymphae]|jgi:large subunit ribosomal protein L28|nr:50S ribosomal protein L28 [Candidatus Ancillula trichonymphae]
MAARCDICAKGPSFGHNVSHSQVKTNRRWSPNIQVVRVSTSGNTKKLHVCVACIKAGKAQRLP